MKVFGVLSFALIGFLAGAFFAAGEATATRVVMGCVGALVGAAIGGALFGVGSRRLTRRRLPGISGAHDVASAFWRDRGKPPLW